MSNQPKSSCISTTRHATIQYKEGTYIWTWLTHQEDLWESQITRGTDRNWLLICGGEGQTHWIIAEESSQLNRSSLLAASKKTNGTTRRMSLVVTYASLMPDVHQIVRKHMVVLYRSSRMRNVFQDPPIVTFRRDKNLCGVLVHGKTNGAMKPTNLSCKAGCDKCDRLSRNDVTDTTS